jgi:hypothetical protein
MTPRFDIFQMEPAGEVRWHASAATIDDAKERIQQLAALSPGHYLVLNQTTGTKVVFALDGADGAVKTISPE